MASWTLLGENNIGFWCKVDLLWLKRVSCTKCPDGWYELGVCNWFSVVSASSLALRTDS